MSASYHYDLTKLITVGDWGRVATLHELYKLYNVHPSQPEARDRRTVQRSPW